VLVGCAFWLLSVDYNWLTTALAVTGHFGTKTLRPQDISALVSGHFGTNAWTLRHYIRTPMRQCAGLHWETTFKDIQGHRYYIQGRGLPKVTGNVTTQYSAYNFLYSTLIETIRLSFASYSELFCQKSHILTYPACIWPEIILKLLYGLPLSVIPHVLSLLIWPSGWLHRSRQTQAKTLRHLGWDSSALGARQFGT